MNNVVDRFDLRPHLTLSTSVIGADWNEDLELWEVHFQNAATGYQYTRRFQVVVSACGIFSRPKFPDILGMDTFKGKSWHSGRWESSVDLSGKKVAVIGNGCSGSQLIPAIAGKVQKVVHFARSKQWLFERVSPSCAPSALSLVLSTDHLA